jgi:hypothetical protein
VCVGAGAGAGAGGTLTQYSLQAALQQLKTDNKHLQNYSLAYLLDCCRQHSAGWGFRQLAHPSCAACAACVACPCFCSLLQTVIKEFCGQLGVDNKQVQGVIRLAKKNGEKLGFLA